MTMSRYHCTLKNNSMTTQRQGLPYTVQALMNRKEGGGPAPSQHDQGDAARLQLT
jgi:hypothetical protein